MTDDHRAELDGEESGDVTGEKSGGATGEKSGGATGEKSGDVTLRERVETWLAREMPIIQMHGGTSAVREADPDAGEVVVELGGGCSGCSVSDVTTGNIEAELLTWDEIEDVTVRVPDPREQLGGPERAESIMGIDRTEGGRGDWGSSNPGEDHL